MNLLELDDNFQPKTELGKAMKKMVDNGDHCDGNIYWLIKQAEKVEKYEKALKEIESNTKVVNWKQSVKIAREVLNENE